MAAPRAHGGTRPPMYNQMVLPFTVGGGAVGALAFTGYSTARDIAIGVALVLVGFVLLRLGLVLSRRADDTADAPSA